MRKLFPPFLKTTALIFLFHFCFLQCGRIVFYYSCKPDTIPTESGISKAFFTGLIFDLIICSYPLFVPLLLLFVSDIFLRARKHFTRAAFILTFLFLSLSALLYFTNLPYFKQFGSHITRAIFLWNASPRFIVGLIFGNFSYYGFFILFIFFEVLLFLFCSDIFKKHLNNSTVSSTAKTSVFFALTALVLTVGARGRISAKSPAHAGMAIVGSNAFANQLALNPQYTFFNSFVESNDSYEAPADLSEAFRFVKKYFNSTDTASYSINRSQSTDSSFLKCNIVIVCMESMSAYKTGIFGRETLTPRFNDIISQSLYFDRFFSTGIHTSNGLFSVCSGFPTFPGEQPLSKYVKAPFTTLANLLETKNYQSYFLSTHDPEFDNMAGFFKLNGFKNIYSGLDMPSEKNISVTGVPDHELFDFFVNKIQEDKPKNFLAFIMTGSDHGPWKIPDNIPFKPDGNSPQKKSTQYADWALGNFMENAKKQEWYNNTLFVFVGDHGSYFDNTYEMALSYHHVPFVMHMPSRIKPSTSHKIASQYDVMSTVAGFMNLSFINGSFGKNLLKEDHKFVCVSADDKTGCLTEGYFYFHHQGQNFKRLMHYESLDQTDYYTGEKEIADSLEKQSRYFMDAARYILNTKYAK